MIELPEIFKNDTQGNTTHLVPLIIINDRLYLSTQKTKLDGKVYSPFLKMLGNISEGVDIVARKYKVSNSRITFYNYTYNNAKLIDVIMQEETFNTPIEVYYKSQNAKSLDDCLRVYSGYIKNIEERKDDIQIESEDKTEQVLGKEIPQRFTPSSENLPEKHRNAPIPIVYGSVDRCPLVYELGTDVNNKLIADDKYINEISKFLIYTNENYLEVELNPDQWKLQCQDTLFDTAQLDQWEINDNNEILIDKTIDLKDPLNADASATYLTDCSPLRYGFVQVLYKTNLTFVNGYYRVIKAVSGSSSDNTYGMAPVKIYKDIDNNQELENIYDGYLDVRDFGTIPDVVSDGSHWIYGSDFDYFESSEPVQYWGKTWLNFQGEPMPDESNVILDLKTSMLETSDDEYTEPKEINPCRFRTNYNIDFGVHKDYWDNIPSGTGQGESYDQLYLRCILGDNHYASSGGFAPEDLNENQGGYIANSTGTSVWQNQKTSVTNTDISISNYYPHRGEFIINPQAGSLQWLKINEFQVEKKLLLKDFDKYDLYASVIGRLDNQGLRYTTSLTTLTTEGRAVRPTRDMPSTPTAPTRVTKPRRTQKAIKKQVKTTSKGGY